MKKDTSFVHSVSEQLNVQVNVVNVVNFSEKRASTVENVM